MLHLFVFQKSLENLEQLQSLVVLFELVMIELKKSYIPKKFPFTILWVPGAQKMLEPLRAGAGPREPAPGADAAASGYYLARPVWQNVIRNYIRTCVCAVFS